MKIGRYEITLEWRKLGTQDLVFLLCGLSIGHSLTEIGRALGWAP